MPIMNELLRKTDHLKYSHKNKNGEHTEIEIPWDRTTFLVFLVFLFIGLTVFIGLSAGLVESEDIQKIIAFVKTILP